MSSIETQKSLSLPATISATHPAVTDSNLSRWKERARHIVEQQTESVPSSYHTGDWQHYESNKGAEIDASAAVAWILSVEHGGHRDFT